MCKEFLAMSKPLLQSNISYKIMETIYHHLKSALNQT